MRQGIFLSCLEQVYCQFCPNVGIHFGPKGAFKSGGSIAQFLFTKHARCPGQFMNQPGQFISIAAGQGALPYGIADRLKRLLPPLVPPLDQRGRVARMTGGAVV
jgi:hypothetical protein